MAHQWLELKSASIEVEDPLNFQVLEQSSSTSPSVPCLRKRKCSWHIEHNDHISKLFRIVKKVYKSLEISICNAQVNSCRQ